METDRNPYKVVLNLLSRLDVSRLDWYMPRRRLVELNAKTGNVEQTLRALDRSLTGMTRYSEKFLFHSFESLEFNPIWAGRKEMRQAIFHYYRAIMQEMKYETFDAETLATAAWAALSSELRSDASELVLLARRKASSDPDKIFRAKDLITVAKTYIDLEEQAIALDVLSEAVDATKCITSLEDQDAFFSDIVAGYARLACFDKAIELLPLVSQSNYFAEYYADACWALIVGLEAQGQKIQARDLLNHCLQTLPQQVDSIDHISDKFMLLAIQIGECEKVLHFVDQSRNQTWKAKRYAEIGAQLSDAGLYEQAIDFALEAQTPLQTVSLPGLPPAWHRYDERTKVLCFIAQTLAKSQNREIAERVLPMLAQAARSNMVVLQAFDEVISEISKCYAAFGQYEAAFSHLQCVKLQVDQSKTGGFRQVVVQFGSCQEMKLGACESSSHFYWQGIVEVPRTLLKLAEQLITAGNTQFAERVLAYTLWVTELQSGYAEVSFRPFIAALYAKLGYLETAVGILLPLEQILPSLINSIRYNRNDERAWCVNTISQIAEIWDRLGMTMDQDIETVLEKVLAAV